jgi:hypothetical protein
MMRKNIKFIILGLMLAFLSSSSYAATYSMPTDCANLHACFALMSADDTLSIEDGTYTGSTNTISHSAGDFPPNGSGVAENPNGGYTVVKAENDGQVTFDGEQTNRLFYFNSGTHTYLVFRGMKFINTSTSASTKSSVSIFKGCDSCDYIKFIRVGSMVHDHAAKASAFVVWNSSYILFEECYAWGEGRYGFLLTVSDHIVMRRNVARLDAAHGGGNPISNFQSYTSSYVEWQNNIAIDSDSTWFDTYSYIGSGFNTRSEYVHGELGTFYSEDNRFTGNVALNIHYYDGGSSDSETTAGGPAYQIAHDGDIGLPNIYNNNVGWDVSNGIRKTGSMVSTPTADNMTLFAPHNPPAPHAYSYNVNQSMLELHDSIMIGGASYGIGYVPSGNNDYNVIYDTNNDFTLGSVAGDNDKTVDNANAIDPVWASDNTTGGLKYIVRIEPSSNLSTISSTSGIVGATVLYQYGVSGTLWGETGYNTLTTTPLWPFTYEDQIRTDFRTYNPGGTDETKPDGERGFGADGTSLTDYVWGYLGNTIPPMSIEATPGNQQATISWDTPVNTTNITEFKVYDVTGSPSLVATETYPATSSIITGLDNDTEYDYVVTTIKSDTGESGYSYQASATPSGAPLYAPFLP